MTWNAQWTRFWTLDLPMAEEEIAVPRRSVNWTGWLPPSFASNRLAVVPSSRGAAVIYGYRPLAYASS